MELPVYGRVMPTYKHIPTTHLQLYRLQFENTT